MNNITASKKIHSVEDARQLAKKRMVKVNLINQILLSGGNKLKNGEKRILLIL